MDFQNRPLDLLRIGFVGTGGMGTNHITNLVRMPGVVVKAICDVREDNAERASAVIQKAGHPAPTLYTRGEHDFERLCAEEDLDLVYTATPWEWHTTVCVTAMRNGKHAATEVPAAVTLEECWRLVDTAEATGKLCVMSENCCYDRPEMMILNMVRKGLLGDLLYAECGYLHDLRDLKFENASEGLWRRAHSERRNGDIYPTHGVGPVAQCMGINRGNRFVRLVSMGTKSVGLKRYAERAFGAASPFAKADYALSDIVTTMIQTADGQTIIVKHDTDSPRPYSRDVLVQGTNGIIRVFPQELIHIEGKTEGHDWEPVDAYRAEYEHPLWVHALHSLEGIGGHGNMDYLVDYRLTQCLRAGAAPDMDVYDAATWSAISALSERSIAQGSQPVEFPDFTRGAWRDRTPLGIVSA